MKEVYLTPSVGNDGFDRMIAQAKEAMGNNWDGIKVYMNAEFAVEAYNGEVHDVEGLIDGLDTWRDYDEYHQAFGTGYFWEDHRDEIRNSYFFTGLRTHY